ncbi:MAG: tetratricopeptide repeat protein [Candidatus Hydrogenedentes bacterium]|nr:tetratricopeptide repeat protein [Candidatus Hydrogenedentota bacterium]
MSTATNFQFRFLAVATIGLAGVLCYVNTFPGEFVWDDVSSVLIHKHVQDPSKFTQLFMEDQHAFGRGQGNFYRPLVSVSFMVDYLLSRPPGAESAMGPNGPVISTFVFHLTNMLWHMAAALLFFAVLVRLDAPRFVQLAAPLLYVCHPLHTEAVAYISGRADPMSAAFMFAALLFALQNDRSKRRIASTVLSCLCFALAVISKESALILPALLVLAFLLFRAKVGATDESHAFRPLPALLGSLVLLGAYVALRTFVLKFQSDTAPRDLSMGQRIAEVGQAFALYLKLIFVPTGLHMERTLDGYPAWLAIVGYALLLVCVGVFLGAWVRGNYRIAFGMGLFLVGWFPVSGAIPLNAPMAEHWLYVPLAGFLLAFLELFWTVLGSRAPKLAYPLVYAACALFVALTVQRNLDWRSNESLYLSTLKYNPTSARIQYNLAVTYEDLLHNPFGARRHYEEVIKLYAKKKAGMQFDEKSEPFWDEELESHLHLGQLFMQEQRFDKAVSHLATLMRISPNEQNRWMVASASIGLGQCMLAAGQPDEARKYIEQAGAIDPERKPEVDRMLKMLFGKAVS